MESLYVKARDFINEMDKRSGSDILWVDHDHTFAEAFVEFAERNQDEELKKAFKLLYEINYTGWHGEYSEMDKHDAKDKMTEIYNQIKNETKKV